MGGAVRKLRKQSAEGGIKDAQDLEFIVQSIAQFRQGRAKFYQMTRGLAVTMERLVYQV